MKRKKVLTGRPKIWRSVRLDLRDIDAWRTAAGREEISQSEFLRRALRERAAKVLVGKITHEK